MKYSISWIESDFIKSYSCHSLIKAFCEVYGVKEFIIKCKKFSFRGSHFIFSETYDYGFHYMISCFLNEKQINKLYRELCKNA